LSCDLGVLQPITWAEVELFVRGKLSDGAALRVRVRAEKGPSVPTQQAVLAGKIVFKSNRTGQYELYAMDPSGTVVARLTHGEVSQPDDPVISPYGNMVAFTAIPEGSDRPDIFVMRADGSDLRQLTPGTSDENPSWSPDGRRIAFDRLTGEGYDVFVMNADGTGVVQLTSGSADEGDPAWSPDGKSILFTSDRTGDHAVYLQEIGSVAAWTPRPKLILDQVGADDLFPSWSPDGRSIVFVRDQRGNPDVWIARSDGRNASRLAGNSANDKDPAFSRDGQSIVFESNRKGGATTDIFLMFIDGTEVTRLTLDDADDEDPDWR
jgi:TolB protein